MFVPSLSGGNTQLFIFQHPGHLPHLSNSTHSTTPSRQEQPSEHHDKEKEEEALMMPSVLELPEDLIFEIFGHVHFTTLVPLMCTSKRVYDLIKTHERSLCKSIYLAHLDVPPHDLDWVQEVRDLALVSAHCRETANLVIAAGEMLSIGKAMLRLAKNATSAPGIAPFSSSPTHLPSRNVVFLTSLFEDPHVRDLFLYLSGIFNRPPGPHVPSETFWDRDLAISQLHCLYGRVNSTHANTEYPLRGAHEWAQCKVYNIVEYTVNGNWGPFRDDREEEVDWTRVEAAMVVLANNTSTPSGDRLGCLTRAPAFSGSYPNSFSCPDLRREPGLDVDTDPYGITGTWVRVISRMELLHFRAYNSLLPLAFHWNHVQHQLKRQITKHVIMDLRATRTERVPGTEGLPIAHFEGFARPMNGFPEHLFEISGTCRMTAAGDVRWKMLCIYDDTPKWRVDAVQIGGVRSGRGAVGTWFPANYATGLGVGPIAFWKTSDKRLTEPQPEDLA